eukprot:12491302-Alexandrium_andersonii.AAC.1
MSARAKGRGINKNPATPLKAQNMARDRGEQQETVPACKGARETARIAGRRSTSHAHAPNLHISEQHEDVG